MAARPLEEHNASPHVAVEAVGGHVAPLPGFKALRRAGSSSVATVRRLETSPLCVEAHEGLRRRAGVGGCGEMRVIRETRGAAASDAFRGGISYVGLQSVAA